MFIELHPRTEDLTRRRFGRLVVLGPIERVHYGKGSTQIKWLCECDCGTQTRVYAQCLRRGESKSCGCYKIDAAREAQTVHGLYGTPEYVIWGNMKSRCFIKSNPNYVKYGERGILMCERWHRSFEAFLADMGPRPSPSHSIDRIDNDGNYEPGNCRWATPIEQANNSRINLVIEAFGRKQTCAQWARELGMREKLLRYRIAVLGWNAEKALSTPVRAHKPYQYKKAA